MVWGPIETTCANGWMEFRCGKKEGIFFEVKETTYMETIQNLLKSCMSFGSLKESRRVLLKKNWETSSTVKSGETLLEAGLVKIPRDSSCMAVLQKLLNVFG